ncbi:hypothetical protein HY637_05890 [Candidatus Woesearchaeota archaeon]|nr:hypothetical protein [Candidatus Woesearchaeota archaeon]
MAKEKSQRKIESPLEYFIRKSEQNGVGHRIRSRCRAYFDLPYNFKREYSTNPIVHSGIKFDQVRINPNDLKRNPRLDIVCKVIYFSDISNKGIVIYSGEGVQSGIALAGSQERIDLRDPIKLFYFGITGLSQPSFPDVEFVVKDAKIKNSTVWSKADVPRELLQTSKDYKAAVDWLLAEYTKLPVNEITTTWQRMLKWCF